ncbi:unnamed protein product [Prunus armeniaca]
MELTKAIRIGHFTENLGKQLLMLVEMLKKMMTIVGDLLPEGNTILASMYEAKNTLCALGLSYEKMHACPNDCILYRKEYEDSTNCPTCGISRWKEDKDSILKEGVPEKVVWYFPPIPRFKRMFQSYETAKSLT